MIIFTSISIPKTIKIKPSIQKQIGKRRSVSALPGILSRGFDWVVNMFFSS